jgi:hypothetical protein
MEFLDIKLKKDMSLLLLAILIPFYWRILKKTILLSGFKNSYKNIFETRKLESIHEQHFVDQKNEDRKSDKKLEPEKNRVDAQKPLLKMTFKNSISIHAKMIRCANIIHRKYVSYLAGFLEVWAATA